MYPYDMDATTSSRSKHKYFWQINGHNSRLAFKINLQHLRNNRHVAFYEQKISQDVCLCLPEKNKTLHV